MKTRDKRRVLTDIQSWLRNCANTNAAQMASGPRALCDVADAMEVMISQLDKNREIRDNTEGGNDARDND